MKNLLPLLFLLLTPGGYAQEGKNPDYYRENYLRYMDYTYVPNIHTVLLHNEGVELSTPLLNLGSNQRLHLSFDDLEGGIKNFKYTFLPCDDNWQALPLRPFDYLEGFEEDYIRDYRFSFNTLQPYTHYDLLFPGENISIKRSGNYIILVFPENERENPILSRRFFVVDAKLKLSAMIHQASSVEDRHSRQEVDFSVFSPNFTLVNPYQNLRVIIRQNGRWDNAITNLKPLLVKGSELDYNHDTGNSFNGGNEFRRFDTKSVKYPSENVQRIEAGRDLYEVYLRPGERRPFKVYVTEDDINGRKYIKSLDGREAATEADYVRVHFSLPYATPMLNGNMYLLGALTEWQYRKEGMMTYDYETKTYRAELFLKQGYYNYQFVFLENDSAIGDETRVEGNHHETENEYSIFVYYRQPGTDYVQLLAAESYNTRARK